MKSFIPILELEVIQIEMSHQIMTLDFHLVSLFVVVIFSLILKTLNWYKYFIF